VHCFLLFLGGEVDVNGLLSLTMSIMVSKKKLGIATKGSIAKVWHKKVQVEMNTS